MAGPFSKFSYLSSGIQRTVDLLSSGNVLQVDALESTVSVKIGSNTITAAIAGYLLALQNGSDFATGTNAHTHDGRYFTESELSATTNGSSGASLIGVDQTPAFTNFTGATVQAALESIDSALTTVSGADKYVKVTSSDTTSNYLDPKVVVSNGSNTTNALEKSILNPSGNSQLQIQLDQSKIDHGSIAGLGDDDHTQYHNDARALTWLGTRSTTDLPEGTNKYYTATQARTDLISSSITNGDTTHSPSGDAVFDALALKASIAYVDGIAAGIKPKQAVRAATTANITIATDLNSGDSIDGVTLANGDRVLVKNQSTASQNGIYVVGASPARSSDFDSLSPIDEINGAWMAVQEGTANAGKVFVQYGTVTTLDTDAINFTIFNDLSTLVGGDMITVSGGIISVDLAATSGLESTDGTNAGELRVKLEASSPTLQINGSNELGVKFDAASGLATSASGLKVLLETSNPTLKFSSGELGIKRHTDSGIDVTSTGIRIGAVDGSIAVSGSVISVAGLGISTAKIQNSAVTYAKIQDVSATDKLLGRSSVGAGPVEEIACTAAGRALLDDVDAAAQRTTLGLGTLATQNGTFSGTSSGTNTGDQTITLTGDVTGSGTGSFAATITQTKLVSVFVDMVAGEALTAGDVVYLSTSVAGEVLKADADALSTCEGVIGIAHTTVSASDPVKIQVAGKRAVSGTFASGDRGKRVYLSGTAGAATATAPSAANSVVFLLGHLVDHATGTIVINPMLVGIN